MSANPNTEENDIYIIPSNFIDTGTIFGGTLKLRNTIEALILSLTIGIPEFYLPVDLTTKIIIACLTVLPLALFALIGIGGESLSSFAIGYLIFLRKRRVMGISLENETAEQIRPKGLHRAGKYKKVTKKK